MPDKGEGHLDFLKRTSVISIFTLFSRLLGLLRDMMRAFIFGTSYLSVAFDIAFRIPNVFRNLVAEGALTQAFIPVYEHFKGSAEKSDEREAAGAVIILFALILIVLTIVAWFLVPYLIPYLVHDQTGTNRMTLLIIDLTRLLFPFIIFISISSIYMAIQYSHGIFWSGSAGPALMNMVILVAFGTYYYFSQFEPVGHFAPAHHNEEMVFAWSIAVLSAAIVQMVFQAYIVHTRNISPRYKINFHHPVIPKLFLLMLPAVFGAAVQEIGQLVDIFLATSLIDQVPGAVSALNYSHRLIHLPMGVFGVAVATASLPKLAKLFKENKTNEFTSAISNATGLNFFLLLPCSIGLILLARPVTALLFERGEFGSHSTEITAYALQFYAIGIIGFSLQKLFMSSFYAQKNSKYPALITAGLLTINIGISILLMPRFLHGGLAIGSSIAAILGIFVYSYLLHKKNIRFITKPLLVNFAKIITANTIMAFVVSYFVRFFSIPFWQVFAVTPVAVITYIIASYLLKVEQLDQFRTLISGYIKRKNG